MLQALTPQPIPPAVLTSPQVADAGGEVTIFENVKLLNKQVSDFKREMVSYSILSMMREEIREIDGIDLVLIGRLFEQLLLQSG